MNRSNGNVLVSLMVIVSTTAAIFAGAGLAIRSLVFGESTPLGIQLTAWWHGPAMIVPAVIVTGVAWWIIHSMHAERQQLPAIETVE